jgi:glycosyltransferase involved in cell wall biosynthesis
VIPFAAVPLDLRAPPVEPPSSPRGSESPSGDAPALLRMVEQLQTEVVRYRAIAEHHRSESERVRDELRQIQQGAAWALLVRYRRLRVRLVRPHSVLERLYRTLSGAGATRTSQQLEALVTRRPAAQRARSLWLRCRAFVKAQGPVAFLRLLTRKLRGSLAGRPTLRKRVALVVATYNNASLAERCVFSLWRSLSKDSRSLVRIVLVDDFSSPEVVARLARLPARLVAKTTNEGYAAALRAGLALTEPDEDVVVLNDDVIAHQGWLEALQECAYSDRNEHAGILGPKLLYPDGRIQSAGSYRSLDQPLWFDHCYRFQAGDYPAANVERPVLAMTSACMYIKRRVLDTIPPFGEYPMGYDDVDYCLRAWEAGFETVYCPHGTLTHLESATRGGGRSPRELVSQERFWQRWGDFFDKRRVSDPASGRLRIIYVQQDTGLTGGSRVIFEHANGLARRGHSVEIYSLAKAPGWLRLEVPVRTFATYDALKTALAEQEAIKVATWWETASPVWDASRRTGAPVYFVQDIETSYYDGDLYPQVHAELIASYRKEFHYLTSATWIQQQLAVLGAQARVVEPGIALDVFRDLGLERRPDVVLSAGRSHPLKNTAMLLRAFPRVTRRASLWLFGLEPSFGRGVATQYTAAAGDAEVAELYNRATVFVLTSTHEGFGLPILEAMACGCPVICTDADGNMGFCRDGFNCLIVPQNDDRALAAAIDRLLGDSNLQERLRSNGLATARDHTWERAIDGVEDFYRWVATLEEGYRGASLREPSRVGPPASVPEGAPRLAEPGRGPE